MMPAPRDPTAREQWLTRLRNHKQTPDHIANVKTGVSRVKETTEYRKSRQPGGQAKGNPILRQQASEQAMLWHSVPENKERHRVSVAAVQKEVQNRPEVIEKRLDGQLRSAIASGWSSIPQRWVESFLGVASEFCNYRIKGVRGPVDMVDLDHKVVVEVYGCYRHACPIHHADRPDCESVWVRDQKQRKELEQLGWYVVVVWTHDLPKEATP